MSQPLHRRLLVFIAQFCSAAVLLSGCNAGSSGSGAHSGAQPGILPNWRAHRNVASFHWTHAGVFITTQSVTEGAVSCPSGEHVIAGGWEAPLALALASRPTDDESGWLVDVRPLTLDVEATLSVYADCTAEDGFSWVKQDFDVGQTGKESVGCASGEHAVAGGWTGVGTFQAIALASEPNDDQSAWTTSTEAYKSQSGKVKVFADCSTKVTPDWHDKTPVVFGVTFSTVDCPPGEYPLTGGWHGSGAFPLVSRPDDDTSAWMGAVVPPYDYGRTIDAILAGCTKT